MVIGYAGFNKRRLNNASITIHDNHSFEECGVVLVENAVNGLITLECMACGNIVQVTQIPENLKNDSTNCISVAEMYGFRKLGKSTTLTLVVI